VVEDAFQLVDELPHLPGGGPAGTLLGCIVLIPEMERIASGFGRYLPIAEANNLIRTALLNVPFTQDVQVAPNRGLTSSVSLPSSRSHSLFSRAASADAVSLNLITYPVFVVPIPATDQNRGG
jgi:hypothetical protein